MRERIGITAANALYPRMGAPELAPCAERWNTVPGFDFYALGYHAKTYMDPASQLCLHAIGGLGAGDARGGVITASLYGCLESAERYAEQMRSLKNPWFASPVQFTHSLCNMPGAVATIEFGLRGFANHQPGGAEAALSALWQATQCAGETEMTVCAYEALGEALRERIGREAPSVRYAEGAAALRIARIGAAPALWEVLGFGFGRGRSAAERLRSALGEALSEAGVPGEHVALYVSNEYFVEAQHRNEAPVLRELLPGVPVALPKRVLGEGFSTTPYTVLALLPRFARAFPCIGGAVTLAGGDIVLMSAASETGATVAVCLRRGV